MPNLGPGKSEFVPRVGETGLGLGCVRGRFRHGGCVRWRWLWHYSWSYRSRSRSRIWRRASSGRAWRRPSVVIGSYPLGLIWGLDADAGVDASYSGGSTQIRGLIPGTEWTTEVYSSFRDRGVMRWREAVSGGRDAGAAVLDGGPHGCFPAGTIVVVVALPQVCGYRAGDGRVTPTFPLS